MLPMSLGKRKYQRQVLIPALYKPSEAQHVLRSIGICDINVMIDTELEEGELEDGENDNEDEEEDNCSFVTDDVREGPFLLRDEFDMASDGVGRFSEQLA
jgi:hypothetical protein